MTTPVTADQPTEPVEAIIARHTVSSAVYVAPVLILVFGLTSGWEGAWSAALGVAIVVGNFLLAGWILSISAKVSLSVYHAAALFGFFLRLGLIILTMLLIAQFVPIDRLAFGITAVVAYLVLLSWQAIVVSRRRERNLDWIS